MLSINDIKDATSHLQFAVYILFGIIQHDQTEDSNLTLIEVILRKL